MNIYVVVEGEKTEKKVYEKWIKYVNPSLRFVQNISLVKDNNYVIYAGFGYPFYFQVIDDAIEYVNTHGIIDRLVIAVDSDEMSYKEKYDEIKDYINNKQCTAKIHIVIQHFCIETWALGNRIIINTNPQSNLLRGYVQFFNVVKNDPELLPEYTKECLNRSQFAYKYLKTAVNERYRNLTYSKNNPKILLNRKYFSRVNRRLYKTGHISSFKTFLNAFI